MASTPVPDLELTLTATESGNHGLDLRLLSPDADAVLHFHSETPVSFDLAALDSHLDDDTKYGELLGRMLLADPDTLSFFKEKRAIALDKYGLLRVRLLIRDDALQGIRWERLRVPGDDGFLAALGSSMAQAGVPAVIAMQGNVATTTVATFMPILFEELARDRQIDQAMAAVRGAVPQEEGSWVPKGCSRFRTAEQPARNRR